MFVAAEGKLNMAWTNKYKKILRVAILALLMVALMGPWTIDVISVPHQFPCSYPFVRMEGDFCGTAGYKGFVVLPSAFIQISGYLVTRVTTLTDKVGEILLWMFLPLLVLPFVSTFLLILRGNNRSQQIFSTVAWGSAAGGCLLVVLEMGFSDSTQYYRLIWGFWFYFALVLIALVLELLTLAAERRHGEG